MIEIMINHAEQQQIAHALEQISLGEKVLLSSNGKSFVVLPADEPVMPYEHNPKATMKEYLKTLKSNYRLIINLTVKKQTVAKGFYE